MRVRLTQPRPVQRHEATQAPNNGPLHRVENIAPGPSPAHPHTSFSSPPEPPVSNTGSEGSSAWRRQFERSLQTTHRNQAFETSIQVLNMRAAHLRVLAYEQHEQAIRDLAPVNFFGEASTFRSSTSGETQYPEQR